MAGTAKEKARRGAITNDCRITARCLRETFGLKAPVGTEFASLRMENSLVDAFFEAREGDPDGGEGGERVKQIASRPAFKLTFGRMRGASWLDRTHPPQDIVWLLGAEMHDERHKGRSDAYDILGRLDEQGELFPTEVDCRRLELDRRRRDTENIVDDVLRDAAQMLGAATDTALGTVAGVPVRLIAIREAGMCTLYGAVAEGPVTGEHSGLPIPLTEQRFLGIVEGLRRAIETRYAPPVLIEELADRKAFPGGVRGERPLLAYFAIPED